MIQESEDKQLAVIGHALTDPKFFDSCGIWGVSPPWFTSFTFGQAIWQHLSAFTKKNGRHPTVRESLTLADSKMGPDYVDRFTKDIKRAVSTSKEIGQDILSEELKIWAASSKVLESFNPGTPFEIAFNVNKDMPSAVKILTQISSELNNILEGGKSIRTAPATAREPLLDEEMEIKSKGRVPFGISYLDDALHGIGADELMIISAITGAGKTAIMTLLAANACDMGLKVSFIALEAHLGEIEARLKYQIISRLYFEDPNRDRSVTIEYDDWRQRRLKPALARYDKKASEIFQQKYKNLRITYKDSISAYDIDAMTADITREAQESDILLLDHIHYIDHGTQENETIALKAIIMRLRLLCNTLHKPIVAAAHIKKETFHRDLLMPSFNDIYGSGEISKSADYVVMLAPARCFSSKSSDSYTFMRLLKNRHSGKKTWPTAVMVFDPRKDRYSEAYAFGELTKGDKVWVPKYPSYWALNAWTKDASGKLELALPLDSTEPEKQPRLKNTASES